MAEAAAPAAAAGKVASAITSVGGTGGRVQGRHDNELVMAVDQRQALQDLADDNDGDSALLWLRPNYGASVAGGFALLCFAAGFAGFAGIVKVFAFKLGVSPKEYRSLKR